MEDKYQEIDSKYETSQTICDFFRQKVIEEVNQVKIFYCELEQEILMEFN